MPLRDLYSASLDPVGVQWSMENSREVALVGLIRLAGGAVDLSCGDALHVHEHCGHLARGAAPSACLGCDAVARTCAAQVAMRQFDGSALAAVDQVMSAVVGVAKASAPRVATCSACAQVYQRMIGMRDELASAVGDALLRPR